MKQSIKRIASAAAALAIAFGGAVLPAADGAGLHFDISASAITMIQNGGTCGEGLVWTLNNLGTLTITGNGKMTNFIHGMAPWSIPNNVDRSRIKNVIIGEGITNVGNGAFQLCSNVESVTLPESLKTIGCEAFRDCTKLTDINIPEGVTGIGYKAFDNTAWLKAKQEEDPIVIINSILIDGRAAKGDVVIPDSVTKLGYYAFEGNKDLTGVIIPDSITEICGAAFSKCTNLKSVNFPEGLISIGDYAFNRCTSLKNVDFPEGLVSIGTGSFAYCEGLTNVTFPESLETIETFAFKDCKALEDVYIPAGVKMIGGSAFDYTPWLEAQRKISPFVIVNGILIDAAKATGDVTVPEGITCIGEYAFSECADLKSVVIPEGVTSIENSAFMFRKDLESVTIPNTVRKIGEEAFYNTGLKEVTIPRSVTNIGRLAFGFLTASDKVEGFKIICYDRSAAQTYAYENGFEVEEADDALSLSLSADKEKVKTGDIITVTLNIDENTGLNGFATTVQFDRKAFEFVSAESCNEMNVQAYSLEDINQYGRIPVEWADDTRLDEDGNNYIYYNTGAVLTMKFKVKDTSSGNYQFYLSGTKSFRNDFSGIERTFKVPVKEAKDCTVKVDNELPGTNVPAPYPDVKVEVKGRQFRLKWNRIYYAEGYGIAVYQSGKWRLKVQLDNPAVPTITYTSPKLKPGDTYHVRVCSKVNGKWCMRQSSSYKITIGS